MAKRKVQYKFSPFEITGESSAGMSKASKDRVFKKVADLVLDRTEQAMDRGRGRVSGEDRFKKLSKKYANKMKGGNRLPDLELFGDLKTAQRVKKEKQSLVHTVLQREQEKADGHNQHTSKAKNWAKSFKEDFPKRRFIPSKKEKQTYDAKLISEIRKVIKDEKGE